MPSVRYWNGAGITRTWGASFEQPTIKMSINFNQPRVVVWFSCGAASAVAAKIALTKYGHSGVDVVYCDTSEAEHPDNMRFYRDVEQWIQYPIQTIRSVKYRTVDEVFEHRKYMSGRQGAPCTVQMKKVPRFGFQRADDIHVFGFTANEVKRSRDFAERNHELTLDWVLIDAGIGKLDCLAMLQEAGIELPVMYKLGFKNNNCLGCVKATSPSYWNAIRRYFPDVFAKRAEQSRRIGCKLARVRVDGKKDGKRIFLDRLSPDNSEVIDEDLSCGPQCS